MDRGPHGRRLSTKKLLFRLISFIGEATWPSIMQNVYGEKVVVYITFYFFFIFLRPFYALIIPWSYRTPPSPSYALQCFANLKDLLVFWFTLLSSRIISPLFVKTTTTMTNAMSTFGGPPPHFCRGVGIHGPMALLNLSHQKQMWFLYVCPPL